MRAMILLLMTTLAAGCAQEAGRETAERAERQGGAIDLQGYELVDLTHAFDETTLYWPTSPSRFRLDTLAHGESEAGYFYSAFELSGPEHGGTHLDAPMHFSEGGQPADEVPLERLIGPAVVIDVSSETQQDRDFVLRPGAIEEWEREHGRIADGSIVLLRTGWDRFWPNPRQYLGSDAQGEAAASDLHFPGFGADAVRLLIEQRSAAAIGIDAASIDPGPSRDFAAHRVAAEANVPALENLARLDELPATGSTVIALPMKIRGGSGGPARVVALVPRD